MEELHKKKCVPCEGGIPAFDISEIHKYLKKVNGWEVLKDTEQNFYIQKNFKFDNYLSSEKFVLSLQSFQLHSDLERCTQLPILCSN